MMCRTPFVRDPTGKVFKISMLTGDKDIALKGIPFGCGQCLPCRINKRRIWSHRLMLESMLHASACFVTLTYSDENLPNNASLDKTHVQLWIKRVRKFLEPVKIRYYGCGEYGERSERPHYHFILFGVGVEYAQMMADKWPYGHSFIGTCTGDSIKYVAGYVTKKLVGKNDLSGRVPEFALMSRRPGIGFLALHDVAKLIENPNFKRFLQFNGDIPRGLLHGRHFLPFGRYLTDKLREMCNLQYDPDKFIEDMRAKFFEFSRSDHGSQYFVDKLVSEHDQQALQQRTRGKIFNHRSGV